MNVNLTPELEKMVGDKVKFGFYGSASEVIREALRFVLDLESGPPGGTVADTASGGYRTLHGAGTARKPRRPFGEVLDEIWRGQRARGHVPPSKEEGEGYIEELHSGWDR